MTRQSWKQSSIKERSRGRMQSFTEAVTVKTVESYKAVDVSAQGGRKRIMVWSTVILAFAVCCKVVALSSGFNPALVMLFVLAGCVAAPLQLLLLCNATFLYHVVFLSARPALVAAFFGIPMTWLWAVKGVMFFTFASGFGIASGLALLINTKFMPVAVQSFLCKAMMKQVVPIQDAIMSMIPRKLQEAFGWPFTIFIEPIVIPVAVSLLYAAAQLQYQGECLDVRRGQWSIGSYELVKSEPAKQKKRIVMVLIHGNRFNSAQWLIGKFFMRSREWASDVEFLSVNMFVGPAMRDHTENTNTIAKCSAIAFEQIIAKMKVRGIEDPERIIFMGHSLGGAVSCYINENLADGAGWTQDRHVVSWSAPLKGSDLFLWAKNNVNPRFLPEKVRNHAGTIKDEFLPTCESTRVLREQMGKSGRSYFAITGQCDHLVRPTSAGFGQVFEEGRNLRVVPYLGHFNIKISQTAWRIVIEHLEKERKVFF